MARRRRRAAYRAVRAGGVTVGLLALAVTAVVVVLQRGDPPITRARCAAAVDGTQWTLSPEQADNAALLAGAAGRRGLPPRAVTIALATALQESGLINVDHGDRDSLGLFQQRPSQGWGTAQEVMDPMHATGRFYDTLAGVAGYTELPVTEAAQAVQRSGHPEAYATHEPLARAWASALTGWSPATLTCTLPPATRPGTVESFAARLRRDQGDVPVAVGATGTVVVGATGPADSAGRAGWAVAQWAVAVAAPEQVDAVAVADQVWTRRSGRWAPAEQPVTAGLVQVTLHGG